MNILIYLGSKKGNKDIYTKACIELVDWLEKNNHNLIYGANSNGLMGLLAKEAKERNIHITGIMPEFLIGIEEIYKDLDKFIKTKTMQDRKDKMRELSDVCIAMPGGAGTMEEITEAYSLYLVNESNVKCVVFNKEGYYDSLKNMYDNMVKKGFLDKEDRKKILFTDDFNEIDKFIKNK